MVTIQQFLMLIIAITTANDRWPIVALKAVRAQSFPGIDADSCAGFQIIASLLTFIFPLQVLNLSICSGWVAGDIRYSEFLG